MGKVYIVGAGPGDPELITLKAKKILEMADVVIYDHLIDKSLLNLCSQSADFIYVGKKAGKHTMPQGDINSLIIEKSKTHRIVVRLKGGDPYIFGRGGEEAEELAENKIEFEVIPGISSAIAISSYTGIPLTHRKYSSSVMFLTGHEDPTKEKSSIDWKLLGHYKGTLVFFMGVKNLEQICTQLVKNGMDEKTPAALIMWGTTCRQRSISSTIKDLPNMAISCGFAPPSILIVGDVVRLKSKLNWFEKLPLLGKNIVITRAKKQIGPLKRKLESLGACCIEFPTIKIVPLENYSQLKTIISNLSKYHWVIFTSANGVNVFFDFLYKINRDARIFGNIKVAAIGPVTAEELKKRGIICDFVPQNYVAESIAEGISNFDIKGKNILIPRAKIARDVLVDLLKEQKAYVDVVPVYETRIEDVKSEDLIEKINENSIHMITFTSSSTVKNFFKIVPSYVLKEKNIEFACIGPITASTLKEFKFNPHIIAKNHTVDGLVAAIKEYYEK